VEPSPWAWDPAWPEVAGVLALAGGYVLAQRRFPSSRSRRVAFWLGIALLLLVFVTPLETLATEYLLSAHLLQNVVLAEWAPALLVLGLAPAAAAALARFRAVRVLTRPAVALPLWLVTYFAWHVPTAYDAALRHQSSLLVLEHACYLFAGLVFWWPVFQSEPRAIGSGAKAAYLFAAFVLASPIGLALALLGSPIYDFYEQSPRIWDLTVLRDQQIAGIVMSLSEAVVFFGAFAWFFLRFLAEEDEADMAPTP
jgi:cytochrome c oxidase assembly factor CtaG